MFELIGKTLLYTWVFYLLFLVYCAFDNARERSAKIHVVSYVLGVPAVAFGYVLDVVWNITLGSLLYLEAPWAVGGHPLKWTFTRRLRRHYGKEGWRGKQTEFWAALILPFDEDHLG